MLLLFLSQRGEEPECVEGGGGAGGLFIILGKYEEGQAVDPQ